MGVQVVPKERVQYNLEFSKTWKFPHKFSSQWGSCLPTADQHTVCTEKLYKIAAD